MIFDALANAHLYRGLGHRIAMAFDFLKSRGAAALEPPALGTEASLRCEIDGDRVFALVQRYRPRLLTKGSWEAHRRYIDVQCVIEGTELMGFNPRKLMRVASRYNAVKDFTALRIGKTPPSFVTVPAGHFAIFMPHDAHMPGLAVKGLHGEVKKIVVKVAL